MRVAVATVQVPFVQGGAEIHAVGLIEALRARGHSADLITAPFCFFPPARIRQAMRWWQREPLMELNGHVVDRLICLKFPAWYAEHPAKVAWIIHQYRGAYELWGRNGARPTLAERVLRRHIVADDNRAFRECRRVLACSHNIARRLAHYNGLTADVLYHPPRFAETFYTAPADAYVFFPSRLEELKRHALLLEAMRHVRSPVGAICAGDGGQRTALAALVAKHRLGDRVRFIGAVTDRETLLAYYAHCLGVFFGPYDEDYGYGPLEAMLASKPVITCTDSGGPLEFVVDGETGLVVAPEPEAVADAIDRLYADRAAAERMGRAGRDRYRSFDITWDHVVETLLYD
jgi:glycosyltransferase involved in cell wall biosynthesis